MLSSSSPSSSSDTSKSHALAVRCSDLTPVTPWTCRSQGSPLGPPATLGPVGDPRPPVTGLMGMAKLVGGAGEGLWKRRLARSSSTRSGSGRSESESLLLPPHSYVHVGSESVWEGPAALWLRSPNPFRGDHRWHVNNNDGDNRDTNNAKRKTIGS